MSECKKCGREDGHHLGCAKAQRQATGTDLYYAGPSSESACASPDCQEPRRSADKRVKFCNFHSDPKNRK